MPEYNFRESSPFLRRLEWLSQFTSPSVSPEGAEQSISQREGSDTEETSSDDADGGGGDDDPDPPTPLIHFLKRTDEVNEDETQPVQSSEIELLIAQLNQLLSRPECVPLRETTIPLNRTARLKRHIKGLVGMLLFANFVVYGLWFSTTQSLEALGGMIGAGSALLYVLL